MAYYRLYAIARGHIVGVHDFTAEDDEAAFRHVRASDTGGAMELWEGSRLVARWGLATADEKRAAPEGYDEPSTA